MLSSNNINLIYFLIRNKFRIIKNKNNYNIIIFLFILSIVESKMNFYLYF